MLILCGGVLGFEKLREIKRQLSIVEGIDDCLALMESEIALCERPLSDIFKNLSEKCPRSCRVAFSVMSQYCAKLSAGEAWQKGIKVLELDEDAENVLLALGEILGMTNSKRQSAEIEKARRLLRSFREKETKQIEEKGKSYPLLGFCLAGIVALLII